MESAPSSDQIRNRLAHALQEAGLSKRAASLNAGVSAGYVHSILEGVAEPTVAKLARICEANNLSLAYVIFGVELSPDAQKLLQIAQSDPKKMESLLSLLGD